MSPGSDDFFVSAPARLSPPQFRPVAPPAWPPTPPPAWGGPPYPPPPYPPLTFEPAVSESGLPVRTGLVVTGLALLASVVLQVAAPHVVGTVTQNDQRLRLDLVVTLAFYVVLGLALLLLVPKAGIRLVWTRKGVGAALRAGVPAGLGGGLCVVALNSAIAGQLQSDPRVEDLVGGGGALRVLLTLVVTAMLAPLVEETVFRGICAGTMRAKGVGAALTVSAAAFAVWHLNLVALRYYFLVGMLLALLWWKRGLIASMSAHAAFNGVLTVAAVLATSGVGTTTTFDAISFRLPGGWHDTRQAGSLPMSATGGDIAVMSGPAGAGLVAEKSPPALTPGDPLSVVDRLRQQPGFTGTIDLSASPRVMDTAVGQVATLDFRASGQPGHLLVAQYAGADYLLIMVTGGSPSAEQAWRQVVNTLHAS